MLLEEWPEQYITLMKAMAILFELFIFTMVFISLKRKNELTEKKLISKYISYLFIIHVLLIAVVMFISFMMEYFNWT